MGFLLRTSAPFAAALALAACSEKSGQGGGSEPNDDDRPASEQTSTPDGGGPVYPPGPFGISVGSVIKDFEFIGYANGRDKGAGLTTIRLGDFYNPTGEGKYPEGSKYGDGEAMPRALLINIGAVWCGPCNIEAKKTLPGKHDAYAPRGEFVFQLAESSTPGDAATQQNLDAWTNKYVVDFPATIDPSAKLSALFESDAFPANVIVDTRTMRIVRNVNGAPDDAFWTSFESTMNAKP